MASSPEPKLQTQDIQELDLPGSPTTPEPSQTREVQEQLHSDLSSETLSNSFPVKRRDPEKAPPLSKKALLSKASSTATGDAPDLETPVHQRRGRKIQLQQQVEIPSETILDKLISFFANLAKRLELNLLQKLKGPEPEEEVEPLLKQEQTEEQKEEEELLKERTASMSSIPKGNKIEFRLQGKDSENRKGKRKIPQAPEKNSPS